MDQLLVRDRWPAGQAKLFPLWSFSKPHPTPGLSPWTSWNGPRGMSYFSFVQLESKDPIILWILTTKNQLYNFELTPSLKSDVVLCFVLFLKHANLIKSRVLLVHSPIKTRPSLYAYAGLPLATAVDCGPMIPIDASQEYNSNATLGVKCQTDSFLIYQVPEGFCGKAASTLNNGGENPLYPQMTSVHADAWYRAESQAQRFLELPWPRLKCTGDKLFWRPCLLEKYRK